MKIDEIYRADYIPGQDLTIIKLYSESHGVVQVGDTDRKIQCTHNLLHNPELSLAHVFKGTEMIKQQRKLV